MGIPEGQLQAPGIIRGDDATLEALDGEGDTVAGRDSVQAQLVAEIVGVGYVLDVGQGAVPAEESSRLVLWSFHENAMLLGVGVLAARARTGETSLVGDYDSLAHDFTREALMSFEETRLEVARGESANLVGPSGDPGRAVLLPDLQGITFHTGFVHGPCLLAEGAYVCYGDGLGAPHGDGLELLGTENGPNSSSTSLATEIMSDAGIADQLLSCWSNGSDLESFAQVLLQILLDRKGSFAPEVGGVADFHFVVINENIDRVFGGALEDDSIVAGVLEFGADQPTHTGAGVAPRLRGFGSDVSFSSPRHEGAGEGPRGDDDLVVWSQGIGPLGNLGVQYVG